jgi:hypothetical protein
MTTTQIIEQLAELEHQQWIHWAQALMAEESGLSAERVMRWQKDFIPYSELSDDRKELDRAWARRALACVQNERQP